MPDVTGNGNDPTRVPAPPQYEHLIDRQHHRSGLRVGPFRTHMQCQTCGTVCPAVHQLMTLSRTDTDPETGEDRVTTWTVPGAYMDGDGIRALAAGELDGGHPPIHFWPFHSDPQDNTLQQPETPPAPSPRRDQPSRSPEARRAERERAKRRQRRYITQLARG